MPRQNYQEQLQYNRQWRRDNPEKAASYNRAAYLKDKPRRLARQKEINADRTYNPAKQREYNARWRANNPGAGAAATRRWKEENREEALRRARERDAANPAKRNAKMARYRAQRLQATPAWADDAEIATIYEAARVLGMHVDHVVPLRSKRVCGLHCTANLQMLPGLENMSKGNRYWPDM
jgi:hypothetical protein